MLYDDGRIACDDEALVIRRYYPWGAKRIPYRAIVSVTRRQMEVVSGKWRIWGSGDLRHWWNLDPSRPGKDVVLILDVGGRVLPCITPDHPDQVARLLAEHGAPGSSPTDSGV
ncbi:MAG TPA: hypothetical protein VMV14_10845 [Acidimicrobiales bacterium]|nr:hypothetical protein [Acidimicrobiales bacterium]